MPGTLGRDDNANPGPYFSQGSATPWRTHSCVQRSHSCERVFAADRTCSQECEHGRHEISELLSQGVIAYFFHRDAEATHDICTDFTRRCIGTWRLAKLAR